MVASSTVQQNKTTQTIPVFIYSLMLVGLIESFCLAGFQYEN
jgi:uncharacterized membrane protein YadS